MVTRVSGHVLANCDGRTSGWGLVLALMIEAASDLIEPVQDREHQLDQEITVVERPLVQTFQRLEAGPDAEGVDLHGTKSSDSRLRAPWELFVDGVVFHARAPIRASPS
jgi:hypothetical protein